MRSLRSSLFFALFSAVIFTGCSATKRATEENGILPPPQSSADAVGSVPEDKIADDIFGTEPAKQNLEANQDKKPDAPAIKEEDPFADVKEKTAEQTEPKNSLVAEPDSFAKTQESGFNDSGDLKTYTVKPGDTLMKIAFTLYGDIDAWNDLYSLNKDKIKRLSNLKVGQQIQYHAPSSDVVIDQHEHQYMIKQGDTLAKIADEVYGKTTKYKKLQKFNNKLIKDPNKIFAGFQISYDITQKEIAEAEQRKQERMAKGMAPGSGGGEPAVKNPVNPSSVAKVPSAINPPAESTIKDKTKKISTAPIPAEKPVEGNSQPQIPQEAPPTGP